MLLNIWELEALIFADIDTFNKRYKVSHSFKGDPMRVKEPKEVLMRITKKGAKQYKESHCPEIFSSLDIERIKANCKYFHTFITEFESKLTA